MKRIFVLLILLMGLVLPWACSDNNSPAKPSGPTLGNGSNSTPGISATSTGTLPTSTPTGTPTPAGTAANTPTPTWTFRPTPFYDNNYGTSAAPNGMYYDNTANIYVAEAENRAGTIVTAFEQYTKSISPGALVYVNMFNQIATGQTTPCPAYEPTPYAITVFPVHYPVGVAVSSPLGQITWTNTTPDQPSNSSPGVYPGMVEILDDQTPASGATLYVENNYDFCSPTLDAGPFTNLCAGFGGASFNNPKCLTADNAGHFYVADTGNGYVDEFDGGGALCTPFCSPAWLHRWNGPGSGYPSLTFKQPVAVACDSGDNVYVGDTGPFVSGAVTTSVVQIYTSGGTSIIGSFYLIPGCVINGLAVDSNGDFFVSDTNNGEIEEYRVLLNTGLPWTCCTTPVSSNAGILSQVGVVTAWGDPHGYHEAQPYVPSCMAFLGGGYFVAGDSGNDFLNVFELQ